MKPSDNEIEMLAAGFAIQHKNGLIRFAHALLEKYASTRASTVAGEAVYTLRVRGAIQAWTPTAAAFSIPDGEHQLFLSPAAPQASAEDDWKAGIRKFMDTAIPALAAIANVHTPDEIYALDAMPREPVIDQVRRLSQACEELRRQVRPERPKAGKDAARCTCPSGDGSLRHPCLAHPQGKPPAPSQPTDKEQA